MLSTLMQTALTGLGRRRIEEEGGNREEEEKEEEEEETGKRRKTEGTHVGMAGLSWKRIRLRYIVYV